MSQLNIDWVFDKAQQWSFNAERSGVHCFGTKEDAQKEREFFKSINVRVGKLRLGRRRKIDCTYGFQHRYQTSTQYSYLDKNGKNVYVHGRHSPDVELDNISTKIFEGGILN